MEEISKKLVKDKYWIFWNDKKYNSGTCHWSISKEDVEEILREGFIDGEGNSVDDFLITDYDLNTIYNQGEEIGIYETILPNTKLVGNNRFVNMKNKGAADFADEAILMEVLKDGEWYDSSWKEIYFRDENNEKEIIPKEEIAKRIKQLKNQIISEYSLDIEDKQTNKEDYDYLLNEVEDLVWENIYQDEKETNFTNDIKEMVEGDTSIRRESIQQTVSEIKETMKNKEETERFEGESK